MAGAPGAPGFADGAALGRASDDDEVARFARPKAIAVASSDGTIFVSDGGNHRIRAVSPAGVVSTLAGSGERAVRDGIGIDAAVCAPEVRRRRSRGDEDTPRDSQHTDPPSTAHRPASCGGVAHR